MLFRARHAPGLRQRLRQFIWPRSGWGRALNYVAHRLARLPGTPHSIAAGFACGAAISFTPFLGLHFVLAGLLAWALGANILASAIGTVVGNPWTLPLIWFWTYRIGSWILGSDPGEGVQVEFSLAYLMDNPYRLLQPMFVGSVPLGAVVWITSYVPLRYLVAGYQHARRARRSRRTARAAAEATDQRETAR